MKHHDHDNPQEETLRSYIFHTEKPDYTVPDPQEPETPGSASLSSDLQACGSGSGSAVPQDCGSGPAALSAESQARSAGSAVFSADPRSRNSHLFQKGVCPNPAGRPRKTEEEKLRQKELLQSIRDLSPKALEALEEILCSSRVAALAKIRAVEIVLSYALGKPEMVVKLSSAGDRVVEASERIERIVRNIRIYPAEPRPANPIPANPIPPEDDSP